MAETPKSADKQPDQADPQNGSEKAGTPPAADQRRVLVCLNCWHIWEAKAGTVRPQCFECKRQRVRPATPEEIAQFDQGATKVSPPPAADPGKEKSAAPAPKTADKQPDQTDPNVDQRIDPLKLVDPGRRKMAKSPPPVPPAPSALLVVFLVVILGVIAALYIIFSRRAKPQYQDLPPIDDLEETPAPTVPIFGASLPGMG